jgi:hypothetical protein
MNLPYPFESARGIKPDALGRIALVDESGKVLTHLPLEAAYGIAPERNSPGYGFGDGYGYGYGFGYGDGYGDGYGYVFGDGFGGGYGDGDGDGYGDGSGKGQAKSP